MDILFYFRVCFNIDSNIIVQNIIYELNQQNYCKLISVSGEQFLEKTKVHLPNFLDRSSPPTCGEICSYTGTKQIGNNESQNIYPQLRKKLNCKNILERMAWENPNIEYPPPKKPPAPLLADFTQNGDVPIDKYWYRNDVHLQSAVWTPSNIRQFQTKDQNGIRISPYKTGRKLSEVIKRRKKDISGKKGVVVGTAIPWVEALLLNNGANKLTTLEYATLILQHPKLTVMHPVRMAKAFLSEQTDLFDFGVSFSSLEHSGLGRYGDPINPFGDLEAMAQIWCMMKPEGIFILGVPVTKDLESSYLQWNVHRIYGKSRLPHLTANWELLEFVHADDVHGIFVLKKSNIFR